MTRGWRIGIVGVAIGVAAACGGGSNSGGGGAAPPTAPSPTPPPAGGAIGATITLTASGVSSKEVRIDVGDQVQFVNSGTRNVAVTSDPHPTHELCPPINGVGMLAPGQSRSATLSRQGTCSFHDHDNPDDERFRGTILVGVTQPGPSPDYRTSQ